MWREGGREREGEKREREGERERGEGGTEVKSEEERGMREGIGRKKGGDRKAKGGNLLQVRKLLRSTNSAFFAVVVNREIKLVKFN